MGRRRDDVGLRCGGGTVAQTWAAVVGTKATLARLWEALFNGLATEAGLPPPEEVIGNIATYGDVESADALAARARAVLGTHVGRFQSTESVDGRERHCLSVEYGRTS